MVSVKDLIFGRSSEQPSFSCCAGVSTAVIDEDGDIFLCQNFMKAPKQIPLGNIYEEVNLAEKFFECREDFCACPMYKYDPPLFEKAKLRRDGVDPAQTPGLPPYDAWLHWYVTEECFLQCHYCATGARKFSKEKVREIDIEALMRTLDRSGLTFRMSFTGGGEPMAVPNIIEACIEITKKHYLSLNTNLVGRDMQPFADEVDPSRVVQIVASLHLQELERTRNIDRFIKNFLACRNAGHPIHATAVATPAVFPDLDRYREIFAAADIPIGFAPFNGIYEGKVYPDSYTQEDRILVGFDTAIVETYKVARS